MSLQSQQEFPLSKTAMIVAQLDASIVAQELHLIQLRRTRNSYLLINRIPSTVLSKIFLEVKHHKGSAWKTADLIPFIHACHNWREVASECTTLWCHIDDSAPNLVGLCLDRSKDADLHINIDVDTIHRVSMADPLNQEMYRIRALRMQYTGEVASMPGWNSTHPSPRLETLWLDSFRVEQPESYGGDSESSLRQLILHECFISPFALERFSAITSLVLTGSGIEDLQVVSLLSTVPQLESLLLGKVYTISEGRPPYGCHLRNLAFISFAWISGSALNDFLSTITFPKTATFMAGLSINSMASIQGLETLSQQRLQGLDCLTISGNVLDTLCFDFSDSCNPSGHHVVLEILSWGCISSDIGQLILESLSPHSITRLDLALNCNILSKDHLLDPFENVQVVRLCGIHLASVIDMRVERRGSRAFGAYVLPNLRKLVFGYTCNMKTHWNHPKTQSLLRGPLNGRAESGLTDIIVEEFNHQSKPQWSGGLFSELTWTTVDLEGYERDVAFRLSGELDHWRQFTKLGDGQHRRWPSNATV